MKVHGPPTPISAYDACLYKHTINLNDNEFDMCKVISSSVESSYFITFGTISSRITLAVYRFYRPFCLSPRNISVNH